MSEFDEFFSDPPPTHGKAPEYHPRTGTRTEEKYEAVVQKAIELGSISKAEAALGVKVRRTAALRDRLRFRREEHQKHLAITAQNVLQEYARIAFFDIANTVDPETGRLLLVNELDEDTTRALNSVEVETCPDSGKVTKVKMKANDKIQALNALARRLDLL